MLINTNMHSDAILVKFRILIFFDFIPFFFFIRFETMTQKEQIIEFICIKKNDSYLIVYLRVN